MIAAALTAGTTTKRGHVSDVHLSAVGDERRKSQRAGIDPIAQPHQPC